MSDFFSIKIDQIYDHSKNSFLHISYSIFNIQKSFYIFESTFLVYKKFGPRIF